MPSLEVTVSIPSSLLDRDGRLTGVVVPVGVPVNQPRRLGDRVSADRFAHRSRLPSPYSYVTYILRIGRFGGKRLVSLRS